MAGQYGDSSAEAYLKEGNLWMGKGQLDRAISNFNKALEIDPRYAEAYNDRGVAYANKGQYNEAISDFDKALQITPRDAEVYNNRAVAYELKGQHDRAISDYNKALQINPRLAEAYSNRGNVYARKGLYDQAIADYNKALQINPKYAKAYNNRGAAYNKKGQHEQAITDYTQAIEIDPRYAHAYENRGQAYRKKGLYDRAISDVTKALQINPRLARAYNTLGLAYADKGQYERAIIDYDKALQISQAHPWAYYNKALACERLGRVKEAIEAYQGVIKYAPPEDASRIAHARKRIEALKSSQITIPESEQIVSEKPEVVEQMSSAHMQAAGGPLNTKAISDLEKNNIEEMKTLQSNAVSAEQWKRFKSKQQGFSIRYPAAWRVWTESEIMALVGTPKPSFAVQAPDGFSFYLMIHDVRPSQKILNQSEQEQYLRTVFKQICIGDPFALSQTPPAEEFIRLTGLLALQYTFEMSEISGVRLVNRYWCLHTGKRGFLIGATAKKSDFTDVDKEFFTPMAQSLQIEELKVKGAHQADDKQVAIKPEKEKVKEVEEAPKPEPKVKEAPVHKEKVSVKPRIEKPSIVQLQPDGKIILVDEAAGVVHLNIGTSDRVYRGLTFSVYDSNAPICEAGKGKAEIEVYRLAESISAARIVRSDRENFIAVGDIVANLIWDSSESKVFVVAGEFDLDSDGSVDHGATDRIRALIEKWGGSVAESISTHTDFMVLGQVPRVPFAPTSEDLQVDPMAIRKYKVAVEKLDHYKEVQKLAHTLSIPVFTYERFIYSIGYRERAKKSDGLKGLIVAMDLKNSLAQISLGATHGVTEGMRFHVTRGDQFICDILIFDVEPDKAVGALDLVQSEPRVGDQVSHYF